jgi:hypothetical protein
VIDRGIAHRWRLLCAVLCGLALSGPAFAADKPPSPARPALAPPKPVTSLTAAQLKKLDGLVDDQGIDQSVPAVVLTRLGMDQRVVKQLGVIDRTSGDIHAYARLRDGGLLLTFVDSSKTKLAYTYRFDAHFKLAASVVMAKIGPSEIAAPDAGALAELSYWA